MKVIAAITLFLLLSLTETKKVKVFKLRNGMKVLFKKTKHKVAAIAAAAKAGVAFEPKNENGLAHMTEHAFFLGSRHDPRPASFFDTISRNGGKFNGFTEAYGMAIYFRMPKKHFRKGLSLFGPIISRPAFVNKQVRKERAAVNSEFERNTQIDSRRGDSILKFSANKGSLYNKFSTGNSGTLKGNIQRRIKNFYKRTFTTRSVKLIVVGNFKKNRLRHMLNKSFSRMRRGKAAKPTKMRPSFNYFKSGKLFVYDSLEGNADLSVIFIIPSQFKNRNKNYTVYLAELLNSQASESLSSSLVNDGLITSMNAYSKDVMGEKSGFNLNFTLTEKGVKETETVLNKAFAYLNALKERMVDSKLFHRIKNSKKWGKPGKRKILTIISDYCHLAWKVPTKRLDSFAKMIGNWKKAYLKRFLRYFVFSNAVVRLRAKNVLKEVNICQSTEKLYEKWVKFNFWRCNLNNTTISAFNTSKSNIPESIFKIYTKQPKNTSLRSTCNKNKKCIKKLKRGPPTLSPKILRDTGKIRLFYLHDTSYLKRKSDLRVKFVFDIKPADPFKTTLLLLIKSVFITKSKDLLLKEQLRQSKIEIIYNPV